jgi:radical SAM superfamily enzyme YgiQ (UPF0313 family)
MKFLLINPPIREWAKPNVFPVGLGYIASATRDAGHYVEVMDINATRWSREEVKGKIRDADFEAAGIGAIVTVYPYVKWLIQIIKKYHPASKVVIGGSVGTSIPYIIMDKTGTDIVCIGEGEITAVEVLNALQDNNDSLKNVDGIWFRDRNEEIVKTRPRNPVKNLDSLPLPAWDLFPMDIYLNNPVGAPNRNKWIDGGSDGETPLSMNMNGTRGCPYKCIYCYHDFMGQGYRHRSAESIISEMKYLYDKYGVEYFHFTDDEFVLKKNFVIDFCEKLKQEFDNKITWGCAGRVNLMTEELIKSMADSGCVSIGYGIESGSQQMLDTMRKGVTVEQARKAIRLTEQYLGWADCSFMIGTPGENRETIQETIDFCKDLNLNPEVIFFATAYPGTELYQMALDKGKIVNEEEYVRNLGEQGEKIRVNFTDLTDEELWDAQEGMIKELNAWNKIKHPESR